MGLKISNNAYAVLAAGVVSTDVSITLTAGQGARFPALGVGDYFYATLVDTANNLEIIKCTARVGDVLTIVRAQDGTTAKNYIIGDRIEIRPVAAIFADKADTAYVDSRISTLDSEKMDYVAPGAAGNRLVSDGANWISQTPGPSGFTNMEVFTSSQTWTIPSQTIKVTVVGGGGGGRGNTGSGKTNQSAQSGGGGGCAIKYVSGLTVGNTLSITVGTGGSGGNNGTGAAGTTSSVSSGTQTISTISATGGSGGSSAASGTGGSGSGGSINISGQSGSTAPGSGAGTSPISIGGGSIFGGGGISNFSSVGAGASAATYGGGGSGSSSSPNVGGNGFQGVVIIEY